MPTLTRVFEYQRIAYKRDGKGPQHSIQVFTLITHTYSYTFFVMYQLELEQKNKLAAPNNKGVFSSAASLSQYFDILSGYCRGFYLFGAEVFLQSD